MVLFLFTHYIAFLYILSLFISYIILSKNKITSTLKFLASGIPAIVILVFWILYIYPIYAQKGGTTSNLSWIETPSIHSLLYVIAQFNGIPPLPKATSLSLLVVLFLIGYFFIAFARNKTDSCYENKFNLQSLPLLIASFLPIFTLFILCNKPFSLNIWGLRHLLPSLIALICFSALITYHIYTKRKLLGITLAVLLISFQISGSMIWQYPYARIPYKQIAEDIIQQNKNIPTLATDAIIEMPTNYYLRNSFNKITLFEREKLYGNEFLLLFRPKILDDQTIIENLKESYNLKILNIYSAQYGHNVSSALLFK
jgi:hypothetical protein